MASLPFRYAVLNLARRPLRTGVTAFSQALAAATLVAAATFVQDLEGSLGSGARDDLAILLSKVAEGDVLRSTVTAGTAGIVAADVPGILGVGGLPAVSSEIHMGTNVRLGEAPADGPDPAFPVYLRGMTPAAFLVHGGITIVEGRPPRTGEVLVGVLAAASAGAPPESFRVGATLRLEGGRFVVSGRFRAPGTTFEAEVWTPLDELRGLTRRDDSSAVFVRVEGPDSIDDLSAFANRRLDLELQVIPSATYYGAMAAYFGPIRHLALVMALLIGGAVLATGANTLITTVRERQAEIGTLRALGYPASAVARSLLLEALILAALGSLLGLVLGRFVIEGTAFRIGMTAFSMTVGPQAVLIGFFGSLLLVLLGIVPAAVRVMRLPVALSQRED